MDIDIRHIQDQVEQEAGFVQRLQEQMRQVIVGQQYLIERLLMGILADGHILIEGVPGLAKTLSVNTLAQAIQAKFQRIQFTPDLLPADLIGTMIYNPQNSEFTVKKGPVFANIILADEINRAPAKVQSALLEAMQERQVTIGETTFPLEQPFLVLATQNPIEQEGTYPLPEAALDRFMFMIYIEYPTARDEHLMVKQTTTGKKYTIESVLSADDMVLFQEIVRMAPVSEMVVAYCIRLARATRPTDPSATPMVKKYLKWGAGPRSGQFMTLGAKALALIRGRITPGFDDVKAVSKLVLRHRVIPNFNAEADAISIEAILDDLVERVPVPK